MKEKILFIFILVFFSQVFAQEETLLTFLQWNQEGSKLYQEGKYSQATRVFEKSLALSKKLFGLQHVSTWNIMNNLALGYQLQGKLKLAQPLYEEVYRAFQKKWGEKHPDTIISMSNLALLYQQQNKSSQSLSLYQKALLLGKEVQGAKHPNTLHTIHNLAFLYQNLGEYLKAQELYLEAFENRMEVLGKKHIDTLNTMKSLGALYRLLGLFDKAQKLNEEALALYQETQGKKHPETLHAMNSLAALYEAKGNYKKAFSQYKKTLHLSKNVLGEKHPDTLRLMNNLAVIQQKQGEYKKALYWYQQVFPLQKEILSLHHLDTLTTYNNIATLQRQQGKYRQALSLYQKNFLLCKKVLSKNHPLTLTVLNNQATLYELQGEYEKAFPLYQKLLKLREEKLGRKHPETIDSLCSVASIYEIKGDVEKAFHLYQGILLLYEEVVGRKHPLTLNCLNNLAYLLETQEFYSKAFSLYQEVFHGYQNILGQDHPTTLAAMNNLAGMYFYLGEHEKSITLHKEALELQRKVLGHKHPETITSLHNIAFLLMSLGKYDKAFPLAQEEIRQTNIFFTQELWGVEENVRLNYLKKFELEKRKNEYLSLCFRSSSPEAPYEALYLALTQKGLLLRISSQMSQNYQESPEAKTLLHELSQKRNLYASLLFRQKKISSDPYQLSEVKNQMDHLEARLSQQNVYPLKSLTVTPNDILNKLSLDETLCEFFIYYPYDFEKREERGKRLAVIVVDKKQTPSIQLMDLGELAPLTELIEAYRRKVQKKEKVEKLAQKIYRSIFSPLQIFLEEKNKIYLVPDGILHQLPFSSLVRDDGKSFIEENYLITLASSRDLCLPKAESKKKEIVIFAAPHYESNSFLEKEGLRFPELPGTLRESRRISQLAKKEKYHCSVFTGKEANEKNLTQIQAPSILHLATHGFSLLGSKKASKDFFSPTSFFQSSSQEKIRNPLLFSGLALAKMDISDSSHYDGILTALEVLNLHLVGTDLVVLSACDTGLGFVKTGEGVYGLQRAFQEAGARSVLATLWLVSDRATQLFMEKFYRYYLRGASPQKALHQTQRDFLHHANYQHPYYWAPFFVVGGDGDDMLPLKLASPSFSKKIPIFPVSLLLFPIIVAFYLIYKQQREKNAQILARQTKRAKRQKISLSKSLKIKN